MKRVLGLVLAISIGSVTLHCTSPHSGNSSGNGTPAGDGGLVDGASAGTGSNTCCAAPLPAFTNIAEGNLAVSAQDSIGVEFDTPPISVGSYAELVVGITTAGGCNASVATEFQEPGSSVFIYTNQTNGRIRIDGPTARLAVFANGPGVACSGSVHYVVAGVN